MNCLLILAAIAVRNPFWPIGFEGEREIISAEPKVDVSVATAPTDEDTATAGAVARSSQTISDRHWSEARKTLKTGGITVVTGQDGTRRQCIMLNGLAYGDGDLVSVNHNGRRFTWRVKGLTEKDTVKLVRIRAKTIEDTKSKDILKLNAKENAK
jgi:hypothetical protein